MDFIQIIKILISWITDLFTNPIMMAVGIITGVLVTIYGIWITKLGGTPENTIWEKIEKCANQVASGFTLVGAFIVLLSLATTDSIIGNWKWLIIVLGAPLVVYSAYVGFYAKFFESKARKKWNIQKPKTEPLYVSAFIFAGLTILAFYIAYLIKVN